MKISSKKRCYKINDIFPNGGPYVAMRILQIQYFLSRSSFYECFSKVNLKTKDGSTVRMQVRYGTPQFLLRSTISCKGTPFL